MKKGKPKFKLGDIIAVSGEDFANEPVLMEINKITYGHEFDQKGDPKLWHYYFDMTPFPSLMGYELSELEIDEMTCSVMVDLVDEMVLV